MEVSIPYLCYQGSTNNEHLSKVWQCLSNDVQEPRKAGHNIPIISERKCKTEVEVCDPENQGHNTTCKMNMLLNGSMGKLYTIFQFDSCKKLLGVAW